jgi:hypothetical protein
MEPVEIRDSSEREKRLSTWRSGLEGPLRTARSTPPAS